MAANVNDVNKLALSLPLADRAALAHQLIVSLEEQEDPESEVASAWNAEITRRVAEIKSGNAKGRPAADVLAEVRAKYSSSRFLIPLWKR